MLSGFEIYPRWVPLTEVMQEWEGLCARIVLLGIVNMQGRQKYNKADPD